MQRSRSSVRRRPLRGDRRAVRIGAAQQSDLAISPFVSFLPSAGRQSAGRSRVHARRRRRLRHSRQRAPAHRELDNTASARRRRFGRGAPTRTPSCRSAGVRRRATRLCAVRVRRRRDGGDRQRRLPRHAQQLELRRRRRRCRSAARSMCSANRGGACRVRAADGVARSAPDEGDSRRRVVPRRRGRLARRSGAAARSPQRVDAVDPASDVASRVRQASSAAAKRVLATADSTSACRTGTAERRRSGLRLLGFRAVRLRASRA